MSLIAKILIGFGIFLFLVLWLMIPYLAERPVVTVDYLTQYNDLTRPEGFSEGQNAATLLENLPQPENGNGKTSGITPAIDPNMPPLMLGSMFNSTPDFTWEREYTDYPHKFSSKEISELKDWLQSCQERLQAIVEASKKPYYYKPVDAAQYRSELLEDQIQASYIFGGSTSINEIGRLLSWALVYHLEKSEHEKVAEYAQAMSRLYKLVSKYAYGYGQYEINELLMGLDFMDSYFENPRQMPSETLLAYQQLLSQTDIEADYNFEVQRLCFLDTIQKTFTEGDRGHLSATALIKREVGHLDYGDIPSIFSCIYRSMRCENRKTTVDRMDAIFAKLKQWKSQDLRQDRVDMEQELRTLAGKNIIIQEQVESLLDTLYQPQKIACKTQAMVTMSAIFRFHEDNKRYPESLKELLAKDYLQKLPSDAFSDGPLKYRKQKDDFILYSVGVDFEDDGGRHSLCKNCGDHLTDWGDGPVIQDANKEGHPATNTQKDMKGDHVFWPAPKETMGISF